MISEPHYPSKWTVVAVFFVLGAMIAGIFLWAFVVNKGTLVIVSDVSFVSEIDGEVQSCDSGRCEWTLTPRFYEVILNRDGYQEERREVIVDRWQEQELAVGFELEPYLVEFDQSDLPEVSSQFVRLRPQNSGHVLEQLEGQRLITTFDTLELPRLIEGALYSFVLDTSRLFFIDHELGRRRRLFDETVEVLDLVTSASGARAVFFIRQDGLESIWQWQSDREELGLLNLPLMERFVQWKLQQSNVLYAVMPSDADDLGLLDEVLETIQLGDISYSIFEVNLDTGSRELLIPLAAPVGDFLRVNDRYFVEYEDGTMSEFVVREPEL